MALVFYFKKATRTCVRDTHGLSFNHQTYIDYILGRFILKAAWKNVPKIIAATGVQPSASFAWVFGTERYHYCDFTNLACYCVLIFILFQQTLHFQQILNASESQVGPLETIHAFSVRHVTFYVNHFCLQVHVIPVVFYFIDLPLCPHSSHLVCLWFSIFALLDSNYPDMSKMVFAVRNRGETHFQFFHGQVIYWVKFGFRHKEYVRVLFAYPPPWTGSAVPSNGRLWCVIHHKDYITQLPPDLAFYT